MPSKSLWLEEDIPKFETFDGSCDTDVAVIGGASQGLPGLSFKRADFVSYC